MKTMRVLMVWGSETNNTQGFVNKIAAEWKEKHGDALKVLDIVKGDAMAERWDEVTVENYDFLLVATSSYGEGEPPSGFGKFLYRLQEASKGNDKPLKGLQHAVLGIGSTCYETFQNCPRSVDKYLGESGSRRCKERFEWDEMENVDSDVLEWGDAIFKVMAESIDGGADESDVCEWTAPESTILAKFFDEDGYEIGQGPPGFGPAQMAMLGAVALAGGAFYYMKQQNATEAEL
jgi:sulfite reductase alpha subunit-like flavoprotein